MEYDKQAVICNVKQRDYHIHRRRLHGARGARAPPIFWPRGSSRQRAPPNNSHAKLQSMIIKRSQNLGKIMKLLISG